MGNKKFISLLVFFLIQFLSFSDYLSEIDAMRMSDTAVVLIENFGKEALVNISEKNGDFHKKEVYTFVLDSDFNLLAHPAFPELVGTSFKDKKDITGHKFIKSIYETSLLGGGWTEYYYKKPKHEKLFRKKSYSKLAKFNGKIFIVSSGIYKEEFDATLLKDNGDDFNFFYDILEEFRKSDFNNFSFKKSNQENINFIIKDSDSGKIKTSKDFSKKLISKLKSKDGWKNITIKNTFYKSYTKNFLKNEKAYSIYMIKEIIQK